VKEMSFKSGVKRRGSFAQDEVNQDTGHWSTRSVLHDENTS